jgi:hypothetical protein
MYRNPISIVRVVQRYRKKVVMGHLNSNILTHSLIFFILGLTQIK